MRSAILPSIAGLMLVASGAAHAQTAVRLRSPADSTRLAAVGLGVTSRASWAQGARSRAPERVAMDFVATPVLHFANGRVALWGTSAFTAFGSGDATRSWTNAIGMGVRRGALSASVSFGQDMGSRSERRITVTPRFDSLPAAMQDSILKGIDRPLNGGGSAPITEDSTAEVTLHAALVGASVAALQWSGSRLSARVYYGVALGGETARRPWAGGDVNLAFGATSLMLALEQRVARDIVYPGSGKLAAHVGLRFDALPWSRGRGTSPAVAHTTASAPTADSRFLAEHVGSGVRFRMHAPGAQRVEIAGSLTAWEEREMRADVGGWWQVELPGDKGLHRLRVRIDGGKWMAPPSVTAARDEFGEMVGVVVVP